MGLLAALDLHGCDRDRLADANAIRRFVDVFSCRSFDAGVAAAIAVAHFGGTAVVTVLRQ